MKNIRNFVIIAHIDHGKSTLADRFLELTGTIAKEKMRPQYLDMMELEREKGVTIKMAPVRMKYRLNNKEYILNLIDTPGHIDFNYEVSRALQAVEGAVLLVDATKGIQAQTIYKLEMAQKHKLAIIPVINKIDRPDALIEETKKEVANLVKVPEEEIILISAKQGLGCEKILKRIVEKVPPPKGDAQKPLRALVFDLKYDPFKGIIVFCRIFDGEIKTGDNIFLLATKSISKVKELGFFVPEFVPHRYLRAGEMGYIATGIKEINKVRVGETIALLGKEKQVEPLPGYQEPKPYVFAGLFPENADDFEVFKKSLERLKLTDPAISFSEQERELLGRGFSCGFLGTFHAEITLERLKREFGLSLIITPPVVVYRVITRDNKELFISKAEDWPEPTKIAQTLEPWTKIEIITPLKFCGPLLNLIAQKGAINISQIVFSPFKTLITAEIPLIEIVRGLNESILELSEGFGSMNYEFLEFRKAHLVKLDILIAGKRFSGLSRIVKKEKAFAEGKEIVKKLKEILPPQQFAVPLQAAIGGKIIARETLKARKRDVLAPLYGGDVTRKMKLLQRQKRGKKKLKERGQLSFSPETFLELFKKL